MQPLIYRKGLSLSGREHALQAEDIQFKLWHFQIGMKETPD